MIIGLFAGDEAIRGISLVECHGGAFGLKIDAVRPTRLVDGERVVELEELVSL